ncbi:ATP-binding cassette domain-containing protein [Alkalilimnicola sp. S0819]|uniref:ATP-binding cassette domain-containing protein n=1 Tax=Alkalilimnicola sp. S0819 TaxID=2613922 RepID=UPI0012627FD3|nr:ATP-binding cassette domain-containing protein [Alkalilimnicola sp. S0819]KAB7627223.1 ABC-F family ATP-binding cassette domain-containing protein [Alkalilimnicola sp. S0819]MPQ15936.1 ATP-binding cassette domain-containing protein [Alkalilimnicola sp. S0819]
MRELLRLERLRAGYRAPLSAPVSLSLRAGETVGLTGPNGCGKSTTLHAVLGQAQVFQGRLWRAPGSRIAYQRQQPIRPPGLPLRAREYLRYLDAENALAMLPASLQARLDTRIDRLSGGQFQLLAVCAALGGAAELVLLDEPTNNLDPDGQAELEQLLAREHPDRGVLLVSHQRTFLERSCERIVELTTC